MARNSRPGSVLAGRNGPRRLRGFTYLGILIAVAFLGIGLAAIGTVWATTAQREREAQLLFAGDAYRAAIEGYYRSGPMAQRLPQELDELLTDAREPLVRHHLRRLYPDPMTGRADWELIRDPDGGIVGVSSTSQRAPLKRANFAVEDAAFEGTKCYCDWKFVFSPQRPGRRFHRP
jgi:type II secretory pathway pseudopilin PulG